MELRGTPKRKPKSSFQRGRYLVGTAHVWKHIQETNAD